ncbi:MAG: hypothetical protein OXG29_09245 [Gammaproteobacteria bacterium]|nr:hypothetical protein [Gammaproteobacteria bacterium]
MPYEFKVHPKADREFDQFLHMDRSTAFDVGNRFRILEEIVNSGLAAGLTPVHTENGCEVYVFFGDRIQMFLAAHAGTLLLTHISVLGNTSWQEKALRQAVDRSREHFGL